MGEIMGLAMAGSGCAYCGQHINAYSEPTGRMTPPFNTVYDSGRWFDGRHVCKDCFKKLYAVRMKEVGNILEKVYPGNTERIKLKRVVDGMTAITVTTMNCKNITSDIKTYEDWKKKMKKKIKEVKI